MYCENQQGCSSSLKTFSLKGSNQTHPMQTLCKCISIEGKDGGLEFEIDD
jgi:hypothetical protein